MWDLTAYSRDRTPGIDHCVGSEGTPQSRPLGSEGILQAAMTGLPFRRGPEVDAWSVILIIFVPTTPTETPGLCAMASVRCRSSRLPECSLVVHTAGKFPRRRECRKVPSSSRLPESSLGVHTDGKFPRPGSWKVPSSSRLSESSLGCRKVSSSFRLAKASSSSRLPEPLFVVRATGSLHRRPGCRKPSS